MWNNSESMEVNMSKYAGGTPGCKISNHLVLRERNNDESFAEMCS